MGKNHHTNRFGFSVFFLSIEQGDIQVSGENCPESKGTNEHLNY